MSREPLTMRVARSLNVDEQLVGAIVDEFLLQLHHDSTEYEGLNGDYIGEELWWSMPPQGYYHMLGVLEWFSTCYSWDPGTASEYLARLGGATKWVLFRHQTEAWKKSERYRQRLEAHGGED